MTTSHKTKWREKMMRESAQEDVLVIHNVDGTVTSVEHPFEAMILQQARNESLSKPTPEAVTAVKHMLELTSLLRHIMVLGLLRGSPRITAEALRVLDGVDTNPDYNNHDETSTDNNKVYSETLEWAAHWIEGSLVGEENERVIEFGKNMAMSIRAAISQPMRFIDRTEDEEQCPECGGCGEVAGAYYSGDGITTCDRCHGKGTK